MADTRIKCSKTPDIKCLSFFSGAMGLDIGLNRSGIKTILASEIDKACRETIKKNSPDIALIGDIRNYTPIQVKEIAGLNPNDEIDVIVGGPPCQAFSTAGQRLGLADERGNVFLKYIEMILALRPKYAVIENVRGLLSASISDLSLIKDVSKIDVACFLHQKGGVLLYLLHLLKQGGYAVSFNLYNSANYGSPQIRERVVILCSLDGRKIPYLQPTHSENGMFSLKPWKNLKDALKGMPDEPKDYIPFPEKRLQFYRILKEGQNWRDLPKDKQRLALGKAYDLGGGKTGFFRRLAWDKPSPTLVTHPAMPATDLAHPSENRPLSVQEYKRIQEFPEDWIICGKIIDQYRQIGNAVPISLGEAIGRTIINHIEQVKVKTCPEFPYSRYIDTDDITWEKKLKSLSMEKKSQELMTFSYD